MVRESLKKWNTPALKKYITEHNKFVRKNITKEIKEKRVAYSQFLKVKREDLKKMQVVDAKGKNKAELIELILKETAIKQRVINDLANKRAPEGFHYMDGIIMKGSKHQAATGGAAAAAAKPKAAPAKPKAKAPAAAKPKIPKIKIYRRINVESDDEEGEKPEIKSSLPPIPKSKIKIRVAPKKKPVVKKPVAKAKAKPVAKAKPAAKQKKYNFNFMKNLKFSNNSSENSRKTEKEIRKKLTISDIKKLCEVYYEKKDYKSFFKMTENLEDEDYEDLVTSILFEICKEQDFDKKEIKPKPKPKAPKAKPKPKPAPEPEETDEEEEEQVAGPIKKVPKKLHSIWKEYMEYKVGDYYTPKDQKEEIDELVDGQKQFLEARKKRKSGNLSAAEQSKQIKIIASYSDAMRDEFNENEGFKKIYKEFAPKLLEDYEESTKAPKKEKKPKKQKKEEVDPETAKQLARFAGRYG